VGQQKPTSERLTEINRALAQRGYLNREPGGVFDDHTAEALKRFQQDQNIRPDGKLNALSLIALGLGPKRTGPPPATHPRLPPGGLPALSPAAPSTPVPSLPPPPAAIQTPTEQKDNQ
jgi:peptidoglycan hydrolase-like protein with peptidoglycan-binding domain